MIDYKVHVPLNVLAAFPITDYVVAHKVLTKAKKLKQCLVFIR